MALKIATNQTTAATTYTLAASDNLYVPVGVSSLSSGNIGVLGANGNHRVVVSGSLFGLVRAINIGTAPGDTGNSIVINATGNVESFGNAISLFGSNARMTNYGNVSGGFIGIEVANNLAANNKIAVINYGTITGDYAVFSSGGTSLINNFGKITGQLFAIATAGGDDLVRNRGVVIGDVGLLQGNDQIINRGTIIGDVDLGDGNDVVDNRGGTIDGKIKFGIGNDTFKPGSIAETADGSSGTDTLDFTNASSLKLALDGSFAATGAAADDTYTNFEHVLGSRAGANVLAGNGAINALTGGDAKDTLSGLGGNDTLIGKSGDDTLLGGSNDDALLGGDGADRLTGGAGKDQMTGDAGADVYIFAPGDFSGTTGDTADLIVFSQSDKDRIDLALVDANSATIANEAFKFVGTENFTNVAGQLRYFLEPNGGDSFNTIVEGDTNGDGAVDFAIFLEGPINLVAADFVL